MHDRFTASNGPTIARRQMLGASLMAVAGLTQIPALPFPPLPGAGRSIAPGRVYAHGRAAWLEFMRKFVTPEGRVVDTGNGGISHSEGQGVGMLSAAMFGTRETFDQLHNWTRVKLSRSYDGLHSWRYRPGDANPVSDPNNATDGDLLIAFALFTAADRWAEPHYHEAGLVIARDVLSSLVRLTADKALLVPGIQGFDKPDSIVINPSYYMFPALRRLSAELPDERWNRVWNDGVSLLRSARFGTWKLPADWLSVRRDGRAIDVARGWPARYSFDAVRLPLYMSWAGLQAEPVVESIDAFWSQNGGQNAPAWTDLLSGGRASYSLSPGMDAIRRFVRFKRTDGAQTLDIPAVALATDYYAAALIMLVHAAAAQSDTVSS